MSTIENIREPSQKTRTYGNLMGIFETKEGLETTLARLGESGIGVSDLEVLSGSSGIEALSKADHFFLAEGEHGAITAYRKFLEAGASVLSVHVGESDDAKKLAEMGSQNGGHHLTYFGPLVVEQYN